MSVKFKTRGLSTEAWRTLIDAGFFHEDDRLELLNGEIVEMSPIGSHHAASVRRLEEFLGQAYGELALISSQNPIQAGAGSEPEPDIALLVPRADFYASAHPGPQEILLLIEVADSSLEVDREVKGPIYAEAGIPEYWIVNLPERRIEVYRNPTSTLYKSMELFLEHEQIPLPNMDQTLAVRDLLP